jgi:hypothetical protein
MDWRNLDGNGKKSLQIGYSDVIDGINGFGKTL